MAEAWVRGLRFLRTTVAAAKPWHKACPPSTQQQKRNPWPRPPGASLNPHSKSPSLGSFFSEFSDCLSKGGVSLWFPVSLKKCQQWDSYNDLGVKFDTKL